MLFKSFVIAGLAAISVARESTVMRRSEAIVQALQNLPTVKSSLGVLKTDLKGLGDLVKGITPANAGTQLEAINKYLLKMNTDAEAQGRKLSSSGEIGLGDLLGFLNEKTRNEWIALAGDIFTAANGTLMEFQAKREIIKASGKADVIAEGLKAQKKSVLDIYQASLTQVPGIIKGAVGLGGSSGKGKSTGSAKGGKGKSGGTAAPASGSGSTPMINLKDPAIPETIGKVLDNLFDQTIAYLKGTQDAFSMPPAELFPSGFNLPTALPSGLSGFPKATGAPSPPSDSSSGSSDSKGKGTGTGKGKGKAKGGKVAFVDEIAPPIST